MTLVRVWCECWLKCRLVELLKGTWRYRWRWKLSCGFHGGGDEHAALSQAEVSRGVWSLILICVKTDEQAVVDQMAVSRFEIDEADEFAGFAER